ncbi:MAG TPA: hypothetical protein VJJ83_02035, partial [Candidatus Babeliales bacterium]|nr:hypothetical protein [Candidatus Babeliales bacterium]
SKNLNTYLTTAPKTAGAGFPGWQALKAAVATGNLQPLNQTVGSAIFNLVGKVGGPTMKSGVLTNSYAGLYNSFGVSQYDPNASILGGLMYFGDASGINASGSIPSYGEPGDNSYLPTAQPMASFFQPSAVPYKFPATGNFELSGGILIKTGQFCNALDTAFGTASVVGSGWIGATCVTTNDCCQNAIGQAAGVGSSGGAAAVPGSIECRKPVAQAPYALDPQNTGAQILYGVCDVMSTPQPPSSNCGATPGATCNPTTCTTNGGCTNFLVPVPGLISGCSCLIPVNNNPATVQCAKNSDCAPTGSGLLAVNNVCNTTNGQCVPPPSYAGFDAACTVPPTITAMDPKGVATTCKLNSRLVCDTNATDTCLGGAGYSCNGENGNCIAGYECNETGGDAGNGACELTCTNYTILNGASCSPAADSPCCLNSGTGGFTCGMSSATSGATMGKTICCILPGLSTAANNAPAFTQADCCKGATLSASGIPGYYCSITRETCTMETAATDCPAINGTAQTCASQTAYTCQSATETVIEKATNALASILGGSLGAVVVGGAGVGIWLYKNRGRIRAQVAAAKGQAQEAIRDVTGDANALQDSLLTGDDVNVASAAVGASAAIGEGLRATASALAASQSDAIAGYVDAAGARPVVNQASLPAGQRAAIVAATGDGGGSGAGGAPIFDAATAADYDVEIAALSSFSPTKTGGSWWNPELIGKDGNTDILTADTNHDLAKAYTMRRILNPGETVGKSLAGVVGDANLCGAKTIANLKNPMNSVAVKSVTQKILLEGIGAIQTKPAGLTLAVSLDSLPANLKAYVTAFMSKYGATFENAYYTLLKTFVDGDDNSILPTTDGEAAGFTMPDLGFGE